MGRTRVILDELINIEKSDRPRRHHTLLLSAKLIVNICIDLKRKFHFVIELFCHRFTVIICSLQLNKENQRAYKQQDITSVFYVDHFDQLLISTLHSTM